MSSLRFLAILFATAPACLSSDHTVSGTLPSASFDCASVHVHATSADAATSVDQTDACGFSLGEDFTFSFSVPDGTEQLQVTFDETSTDDDDGRVSVTLTVPGPIHDDVRLGLVLPE